MGNYDDHTQYGHVAYAVLGIALAGAVASGGLSVFLGLPLALVAYPFVRVGAAFPDIDHHASHPHQKFRRATFVIGTVGSFFVLYTQTTIPLEAIVGVVDVGLAADAKVALLVHALSLLVGVGVQEAVSYFRPKHRGVTHRVPTGIAIAGGLGGLTWYMATTVAIAAPQLIATVAGGAFFAGFLSHLRCDRMLIPAVQGSFSSVGRTTRQTFRRVRRASPL